jgi:hypothetical protein
MDVYLIAQKLLHHRDLPGLLTIQFNRRFFNWNFRLRFSKKSSLKNKSKFIENERKKEKILNGRYSNKVNLY